MNHNQPRGQTVPGTTPGSWSVRPGVEATGIKPLAVAADASGQQGRIGTIREQADRLEDLSTLTAIRDHVRSECGDRVAYLGVVEVGDRSDEYISITAFQSDGRQLDVDLDAFDNFRTDAVGDFRAADHPESIRYYDTVLSMQTLDRLDLDSEIHASEQTIAGRLIARSEEGRIR